MCCSSFWKVLKEIKRIEQASSTICIYFRRITQLVATRPRNCAKLKADVAFCGSYAQLQHPHPQRHPRSPTQANVRRLPQADLSLLSLLFQLPLAACRLLLATCPRQRQSYAKSMQHCRTIWLHKMTYRCGRRWAVMDIFAIAGPGPKNLVAMDPYTQHWKSHTNLLKCQKHHRQRHATWLLQPRLPLWQLM